MNSILFALARVAQYAVFLYKWVLIIAILLTWVQPNPYNPLVRTLRALTEPVLWRARKLLPFLYYNGIDFSPIAVFMVLLFLENLLARLVFSLAIPGI